MMTKIIWSNVIPTFIGEGEWRHVDDIVDSYSNSDHEIQSIGIVIYENDQCVILAQNYEKGFDRYSNTVNIRKSTILKKVELKPYIYPTSKT